MTTVVHEHGRFSVDSSAAGALWAYAGTVRDELGWELKPEGFCKDEICVPVPPGRTAEFVDGDAINLAALWQHLGKPLAASDATDVWSLGESADDHNAALTSLAAPDFELPDFKGRLHRLSDFRRKRVLLITWASW